MELYLHFPLLFHAVGVIMYRDSTHSAVKWVSWHDLRSLLQRGTCWPNYYWRNQLGLSDGHVVLCAHVCFRLNSWTIWPISPKSVKEALIFTMTEIIHEKKKRLGAPQIATYCKYMSLTFLNQLHNTCTLTICFKNKKFCVSHAQCVQVPFNKQWLYIKYHRPTNALKYTKSLNC